MGGWVGKREGWGKRRERGGVGGSGHIVRGGGATNVDPGGFG